MEKERESLSWESDYQEKREMFRNSKIRKVRNTLKCGHKRVGKTNTFDGLSPKQLRKEVQKLSSCGPFVSWLSSVLLMMGTLGKEGGGETG